MTSVLITGAAGHLGRRITRRLTADGVTVLSMVRRPAGPWPKGVEEIVADVARDAPVVRLAAKDVAAVIHLVGASEDALSADPTPARRDSVAAAEVVAASGAPLIVYLSTVHVYGANLVPGACITESTPAAPTSDYAEARLACEEVFRQADAPSLIFRLTNGLGAPVDPAQPGWHVVSNELVRSGATTGRLELRSAGEEWRDFVPLVDVEAALSALVLHGAPPAGTYNFGSGASVTVRTLATEIQRAFEDLTGSRPSLQAPPGTGVIPEPYEVDVGALRALDLFTPTPRCEAIEGVVRECLARRAELQA